MTFNNTEIEGETRINNKVVSKKITYSSAIQISEGILLLVILPGTDLWLEPFTKRMITGWDSDHMRKGVSYNLSGGHIGYISSGPHGAEGDGEYRPITSVKIEIEYSLDKIILRISGHTEKGHDIFHGSVQHSSKPIERIEYSVSLSLTLSIINEMLLLREEELAEFKQRVNYAFHEA